jgi:hypothetical protein
LAAHRTEHLRVEWAELPTGLQHDVLQLIALRAIPPATPAATQKPPPPVAPGLDSGACRAELHGVYFDTGSAALRPESSVTISRVGELLKAQPDWRITIEGHTDNIGMPMTFYERSRLLARSASGFMTLLLLVSLGALAACDNKDNAAKKEQSSTAASTAATAAADKQDPCGLLNPEEVAAVIGPLAGPPYRSNGGVTPSPNGKSCRYETADLHALSVEVIWQGGAQFMGMMGAV